MKIHLLPNLAVIKLVRVAGEQDVLWKSSLILHMCQADIMEMSFCLPCEVDRARNIPATPCTCVVWCHQNEVNTISLCFRLCHTMMNNWYQRARSNTLMKNCSSFIFRDTVLNYLPHVNSIAHSWSWYKRA